MSAIVQGARSFSRSMDVLQLISDQAQPASVAELHNASGLTRPTLYRILAALESEGLVLQNSDRRYQLGSRLISLAHRALASVDIRDTAHAALEQLRDKLGETVHLAIRHRDELIYVDKMESREVVRMASTVGTRVPFHSSSVGKAFLAALEVSEAHTLIDGLPMMSDSGERERLKRYLEQARAQGYAFECEENEKGIACFGGAILNAQQQPIASVSVSVPTFRLKAEHSQYCTALLETCEAISRQVGWVNH